MNIESGFSQVAQSLLWPVLVLVGLAFVYALWSGGATLMEAWQRWRQPQYRSLRVAPGLSMEELELQLVRQVEPVRLLSRLSPMLGLIATMIPMGPALKSLSDGNLAQVSENLTIAFSAVILALIAASITYWVVNVRRRWLAEELLEIEALRSQQA